MPARIWIFWLLFLIRGAFYCTMLPLWEGWDEYAHVAYLVHWNETHRLPVVSDRISSGIEESMRQTPLPRELRWIGGPYRTREELAQPSVPQTPRAPFVFYEAQQPPLYYWIAAPLMRDGSVSRSVFIVRLFSVFLASLAIPFTYLAAPRLGVACAALLAVAPGLAIDAAHVSNDCLAIAVTAIFLWLMSRQKTHWLLIGVTLAAALLTKASLLVLIPICLILRPSVRPLAVAFIAAGWWYARNLYIGAPLTGWQESVGISVLVVSAIQLARTGRWINGAETIAKSFTWFGAWSFLTLRTWMYLALEGTAFAGMLAGMVGRKPELRVPLVFTVLFTVAILAGEAAYNAVHGIAGIPGWYLWPVGGAMAILIAAGLGRFTAVFAAMLAVTDLYGVAARMMPYYAGIAPWNHGSVLQFAEAAARLRVPFWLVIGWVGATVAIPVLLYQGREKTRT